MHAGSLVAISSLDIAAAVPDVVEFDVVTVSVLATVAELAAAVVIARP